MLTVDTLRVAIVADLLEEHWPSMDLVAEMLMAHVAASAVVAPSLLRPAFSWPAFGNNGNNGNGAAPPTIQRIAHRFWSYPRWLRQQSAADVYHIVDHSYAHLAHDLPAGKVVVTCHDADAFQALVQPGQRTSGLPLWLVKRVASGLRRAATVVCDSEATRSELVAARLVPIERTTVLPIGVHPRCTPTPDHAADETAAELTGDRGSAELLHVGSTIPRKRIDLLLDIFAAVVKRRPDARLWRVGGAFTAEQARRAAELGIDSRIIVMPFLSREVLAALYRRASLVLLPSEREGFGLPVVEAMACGTPVVCADLPVLHEVGCDAAEYCPLGEPHGWGERIDQLLIERETHPERWRARRLKGINRAADFSWHRYAAEMQQVYARIAAQ